MIINHYWQRNIQLQAYFAFLFFFWITLFSVQSFVNSNRLFFPDNLGYPAFLTNPHLQLAFTRTQYERLAPKGFEFNKPPSDVKQIMQWTLENTVNPKTLKVRTLWYTLKFQGVTPRWKLIYSIDDVLQPGFCKFQLTSAGDKYANSTIAHTDNCSKQQ